MDGPTHDFVPLRSLFAYAFPTFIWTTTTPHCWLTHTYVPCRVCYHATLFTHPLCPLPQPAATFPVCVTLIDTITPTICCYPRCPRLRAALPHTFALVGCYARSLPCIYHAALCFPVPPVIPRSQHLIYHTVALRHTFVIWLFPLFCYCRILLFQTTIHRYSTVAWTAAQPWRHGTDVLPRLVIATRLRGVAAPQGITHALRWLRTFPLHTLRWFGFRFLFVHCFVGSSTYLPPPCTVPPHDCHHTHLVYSQFIALLPALDSSYGYPTAVGFNPLGLFCCILFVVIYPLQVVRVCGGTVDYSPVVYLHARPAGSFSFSPPPCPLWFIAALLPGPWTFYCPLPPPPPLYYYPAV